MGPNVLGNWKRKRTLWDFPGDPVLKNQPLNAGDLDFIPGAEAETPVLWPPHAKSWLIGKDSDARRDWGQEEKGTTEDEMAGWHHRLDGHESEWTLGVGDGQGGLVCCDSWGRRVRHDWATELNWTEQGTKILHTVGQLSPHAVI